MQQQLRNPVTRFKDFVLGNDRHEAVAQRRQLILGLGGLAVTVVLMIASAVVYFAPIGKSTYTADLTEAGSIRVGDEVRIAGITVGSVTGLELLDESVRMTFTVEREIFVGDESTLDIRMLTAIGGHYVAMHTAGEEPLGSKVIPPDHVTLPYSLAKALQDSTQPLATIDGNTLRANLDALAGALEKSPGSINAMTDAMASFVDLVNRQNTEVNRALDVADEYIGLLADYRKTIGAMLSKIGVMEAAVLNRRAEVLEMLRVVVELLSRIAAIEPAYRTHLEPLIDKLFESKPQLEALGQRLGTVLDSLNHIGTRLQGLTGQQGGTTIDQSGQTLTAPPLSMQSFCIPMPGKDC
ncbi:MCE family protein [Nocardia cyriacigeorgica]|uniref:MCE family protein n=1 Tax=Nocardia cyriacigeorgica TaxID=135487 RepID=A0A5R8P687_9NOCA|nr:MlaD family protein [Nocardia cyriacigeorgica]TLF94955.1 MCE family protein [Nocardia cyriacigeorgica]